MLALARLLEWLKVRVPEKLPVILVFQVLLSIVLFFLIEDLLPNPYDTVVELALVSLNILAAFHTYVVGNLFHQYLSQALFEEMTSSPGIVVKYVHFEIRDRHHSRRLRVISPGHEYTLDFSVSGRKLVRLDQQQKKVKANLYMVPALFLADSWPVGKEFPVTITGNGNWAVEGKVEFDTLVLNTKVSNSQHAGIEQDGTTFITLTLELSGARGTIVTLELAHLRVHLYTKQEVFNELIKLNMLKKLPSGYTVLQMSPSSSIAPYYTNLIVLSENLLENRVSVENALRYPRDDIGRLKVSIARFIEEGFTFINQNWKALNPYSTRKLTLASYEASAEVLLSQPDLNALLNQPDLIESIFEHIAAESLGNSWDLKVPVAIWQTPQFIASLRRESLPGGICVFGFSSAIPADIPVSVIFDLDKLGNDEQENNPCRLISASLKQIVEPPAPLNLFGQNPIEVGSKAIVEPLYRSSDDPSELPGYVPNCGDSIQKLEMNLEHALSLLQDPAMACLHYGHFITSEPEVAKHWIDLGVFEQKLQRVLTIPGYQDLYLQNVLRKAVWLTVNHCIEGYQITPEHLTIVNMCSQLSGIATELKTLWNLRECFASENIKLSVCDVILDTRGNPNRVKVDPEFPVALRGPRFERDVILLVPIDSYVSEIAQVLKFLEEYENNVLCAISLFSIAKTWDYVSASDYFDVIPLFRVLESRHGDHLSRGSIQAITQMEKYQRLKPWLFRASETGSTE